TPSSPCLTSFPYTTLFRSQSVLMTPINVNANADIRNVSAFETATGQPESGPIGALCPETNIWLRAYLGPSHGRWRASPAELGSVAGGMDCKFPRLRAWLSLNLAMRFHRRRRQLHCTRPKHRGLSLIIVLAPIRRRAMDMWGESSLHANRAFDPASAWSRWVYPANAASPSPSSAA